MYTVQVVEAIVTQLCFIGNLFLYQVVQGVRPLAVQIVQRVADFLEGDRSVRQVFHGLDGLVARRLPLVVRLVYLKGKLVLAQRMVFQRFLAGEGDAALGGVIIIEDDGRQVFVAFLIDGLLAMLDACDHRSDFTVAGILHPDGHPPGHVDHADALARALGFLDDVLEYVGYVRFRIGDRLERDRALRVALLFIQQCAGFFLVHGLDALQLIVKGIVLVELGVDQDAIDVLLQADGQLAFCAVGVVKGQPPLQQRADRFHVGGVIVAVGQGDDPSARRSELPAVPVDIQPQAQSAVALVLHQRCDIVGCGGDCDARVLRGGFYQGVAVGVADVI